MTVAENIALPLREHRICRMETIEVMGKVCLEMVGLRQHADKMPSMLSGGMKKLFSAGVGRWALSMEAAGFFTMSHVGGVGPGDERHSRLMN